MNTAQRMKMEARIIRHLVKEAKRLGHTVSVCDGEEWAVKRSQNAKEIVKAAMSVDEARLRIRNHEGDKLCDAFLVFGNDGYDVISDWAYNDADTEAQEFMALIDAYTETQEKIA